MESVGGDCHICRSRPQHTTVDCAQVASPHLVDRKLDLLVKELRRYRVSVAGIQETKWLRTCSKLMAIRFFILVTHCVRKGQQSGMKGLDLHQLGRRLGKLGMLLALVLLLLG